MDSYTPSHKHASDERPPMYQFRGRDGGSGWSERDSYRPSDFSFRAQDYSGHSVPSFPGRNQQLPERAQRHTLSNESKSHPRKSRPVHVRNSRRSQRPWQSHPATSERPLLRGSRAPTPEQLLGMNEGEARFKSLQDLSDSEEEDMDMDTDAEANGSPIRGPNGEPPTKKRLASTGPFEDATATPPPKWSNPDPYTSLPPADETQGKRKDVVKLIRKAKASTRTSKLSAAHEDDFISFAPNGESDHEQSISDGVNSHGALDAPKGSKFSHLERLHPDRSAAPGVSTESISIDDLGPPPRPPKDLEKILDTELIEQWPSSKPQQHNEPIAGRKRNRSEVSDDSKAGYKDGKKPKIQGVITSEWAPKPNKDSTPWITIDHSNCESMGLRLHKEICDFYDFVKPQPFENEMRHALVRRVSRFVSDNYKGAKVAFFGSFAAGTYLPDADMDLVVLSHSFQQRGIPMLGQRKKELFAFARRLQSAGVAKTGSTCTIWSAKVPIVKYVDSYTGLKCDISFENSTGPIANETYAIWKSKFPAMPVLVSMVKQFLLMRGMNEVHTGGLGSFAVTCLVVSLMQHLPQLMTANMDPTQNLGELFMHFLDFYGNKFNQTTTGIQMNPPAYFPKHLESRVRYDPQKTWKLSILDPNRPENDISSGTVNIVAILKIFSLAFKTLKNRMAELRSSSIGGKNFFDTENQSDTSILGSLYAGDYTSFQCQRDRMKRLYAER